MNSYETDYPNISKIINELGCGNDLVPVAVKKAMKHAGYSDMSKPSDLISSTMNEFEEWLIRKSN